MSDFASKPVPTSPLLKASNFAFALLSLAAVLPEASALAARAQQTGEAAQAAMGCTLRKEVYTCNWHAFRKVLSDAQTISVVTESMDRSTAAQLRHLVAELGKTVAAPGQPGDLTFLLTPTVPRGISYGPADEERGTLRIFAPGPGAPPGTLLWAETFRAQPDRPWPAVAHALIEQFQERIGKAR